MSELSEIHQIIFDLHRLYANPFECPCSEGEYNELRKGLVKQKEKTNSCTYCKLLIDVIIHLITVLAWNF